MRKTKITTIILAIILVTLVAFGGVYIKTQNRMENKVADYNFSRELEGQRVVEMEIVSSDEKETETKEIDIEKCQIVKQTIENRLKDFGSQDYTISLNEKDGTIRIELPENVDTDAYASLLVTSVQVQIKEKDADVELLSDSMVKNAKYTYTSNIEGAYQVFLELHLTEEGQAKIQEIKNNYAILVEEVEEIEAAKEAEKDDKKEETTTEETKTEETKKIAQLTIGGSEYSIDRIENGKIRVVIGSETTNTSYVDSYINSAAQLAILINSGKYPVEYEVAENRYEFTDITNTQILYFAIIVAIALLISFIVLTIKYKTKGLLASISYIGFVSILTLILRYTDVSISIEGIGAIILILIINLIINKEILKNTITDVYKNTFLKLVPVIIVTLVFCFAGVANLSSFGMIMFWGLVLIAVYNVTVTKALLKLKESK